MLCRLMASFFFFFIVSGYFNFSFPFPYLEFYYGLLPAAFKYLSFILSSFAFLSEKHFFFFLNLIGIDVGLGIFL